MKTIRTVSILLAGIVALLTPVPRIGQEATGTITGLVLDSTGAAVPLASIEVRNAGTGALRTTQSDGRGTFRVPALQPGTYHLTVTHDGFKKANITGVQAQVNQVVALGVTLQIGEVNESVTVEGGASPLQTESSTVGQVVETRAILELPLNGRQFLQLMTLVPGTISGYTRDVSRQGGERASLNIAVNGGRSEFNNYLLDGVLNTDENYNTFVVSPSVDALQEFKVQTSSYSAQYGRGGAGQINIITKSGTNELHGTLFEFLRNEKLDAKNFFDRADRPIPPYKQNQFGGTVGGPVVLPKLYHGRNKTFFFFNYEGLRVRQAQTTVSTVPLPEVRSGDFSNSGVTVYDPRTTIPDPSRPGQFLRAPFPNNRIPQDRFDPASVSLLKFLPLPNLPGTVDNYLSNEKLRQKNNQITAKVDHQLSANDSFFVRYSVSDERAFTPGRFPGMGTILDLRGQVLGISETHLFGPRTVNEFKFGFNRLRNALLQENAHSLNAVEEAGIVGLSRDPIDFGIPAISVQGVSPWGDAAFAFPSLLRDNVFQFIDNLSLIRGAHTLNLGIEYRRFNYNNFANNLGRGSYNFRSPLYTSNPVNPANTGAGFADYLLGVPSFAEGSVGDTSIYDRRDSWNFYLQNDIKLTRNFTLNLGIRYEFNPYPIEKFDRIETVDISTNPPTIVRAGVGDPYFLYPRNIVLDPRIPYVRDGRFGRSLLKSDKNDWAPRFGFAYSATSKIVVRGAYGVFYSQDIGNPFFDLARNVPRSVRAALSSDPIVPQIDMRSVFLGLTSGRSVLTPTLTMTDPDYRTSYLQQWSFNVQRELAQDLTVEVGYIGSKGTKLGLLNLFNLAPPGPGAPQPRRPWPIYERVFLIQHRVNSSYNALQVRVEKKYARGLSFLTSYTFGKSLDYKSSTRTSGEDNRPINPNELSLERGRSLFDARHNFVFNTLWELPFGNGKTFLNRGDAAGKVLGGWQVSAILQSRTGLPFTVGAIGDIANTGNDASGRANLLAGQKPELTRSQRSPERWFNSAAFVSPQAFTFGNAGRNTVNAPGLNNIDLSLLKNIKLREAKTLQLRSEFFNFTNTPHFGRPGTAVNGVGFGRISSARASRQIQFALKLIF